MKRILYQFPSFLQRLYPDAVWRGDKSLKCVYLTFDDGPVPEVTPDVLDILDRYKVKATFFWVGENVGRYPDLAREVVRRGHRVGNHTYNHLNGWKTPHAVYIENILKANDIMRNTLGTDWRGVRLFRPPYGRGGMKVRPWLRERGYKVVLWDIITHDYNKNYTPQEIENIVFRYVRSGSVILMHDSIKAKKNVLAALPRIIEGLQKRGYDFKSLD